MTAHHVIEVTTPTPCFLPENRDIFDEVINLTVNARSNSPDSGRRRPWIQAARNVCGNCPERHQCLQVHGHDYDLGVIAGATDQQRAQHFEGAS